MQKLFLVAIIALIVMPLSAQTTTGTTTRGKLSIDAVDSQISALEKKRNNNEITIPEFDRQVANIKSKLDPSTSRTPATPAAPAARMVAAPTTATAAHQTHADIKRDLIHRYEKHEITKVELAEALRKLGK